MLLAGEEDLEMDSETAAAPVAVPNLVEGLGNGSFGGPVTGERPTTQYDNGRTDGLPCH